MLACIGGERMQGVRNIGPLVSGIFHILILLIPVSMNIAQRLDFKDIELFVIDETLPAQRTPEIKPKVKQPQKEIEQPVRQEKVIEPVVQSDSKEAVALSQPVEEPVQQKVEAEPTPVVQVHPTTQIQPMTVAKPSAPKDTEFGGDFGPKFLHMEIPQYPMIARRLGKEGRVVLRLTIDEKGNLLNIEVIESAGYGFTEAAVEAVKRSTFLPAKIDGKHTATRALLPIKFKLRRD
jgi:protein TonB